MTEPKPDDRAAFEAKYQAAVELQPAIDAVHEVGMAKSKRWQRFPERFGVDIELGRWASRVSRLASDYDYLIYEEFDNMQMGRLGLEGMMETAEAKGFDDLLTWMVPLVDEVDEVFRQITTLDTVGYSRSPHLWVPSYWFLRRLPQDDAVMELLHTLGPAEPKHRTNRRTITRTELEE